MHAHALVRHLWSPWVLQKEFIPLHEDITNAMMHCKAWYVKVLVYLQCKHPWSVPWSCLTLHKPRPCWSLRTIVLPFRRRERGGHLGCRPCVRHKDVCSHSSYLVMMMMMMMFRPSQRHTTLNPETDLLSRGKKCCTTCYRRTEHAECVRFMLSAKAKCPYVCRPRIA